MRAMIMQAQKSNQHYTVDDYMGWPDDIRCELIDGVIYDMSPAPLIKHQQVSIHLAGSLFSFLQEQQPKEGSGGSDCQVLVAPIDVVLAEDTVVQPDLIVVCDPEKWANGKHIIGAPDAVVEILSPSTALKDRREKKALYQRSGVKEYLLIDPAGDYAEYFLLEPSGEYAAGKLLGLEDEIAFQCLPGFSQPLSVIMQTEVAE
jgi:Uma2 family endonuclease